MTQAQALEILKLGHNVFLTGPAGSGKTFVINQYVEWLKINKIAVGITASTGIAATHINGRTIHSWSGIGINDELTNKQIHVLLRKLHFRNRFESTKVLIIDEVSMLHAFRLDLVDQVCRAFKANDLPFGGIQVILSGDFFQLPPVSRNSSETNFVNDSKAWQEMDIKICYLTEQYRQKDKSILHILNGIRTGHLDDLLLKQLISRLNKPIKSKFTPTKLYTTNIDVETINNLALNKLTGETKEYFMTGRGDRELAIALKKGCLAPEELYLKIGAVVMFVKNNFDKGYVNGTMGKIVDFDPDGWPVVQTIKGDLIIAQPASWVVEENEVILAEICQIPLRLAWAITIHKSQGMSLDAVEVDLSKAFTYGMGYVALSRVRTLNGIKLLGLNKIALQVNPRVTDLDQQLFTSSEKTTTELQLMNKQDKKLKQTLFLVKTSS